MASAIKNIYKESNLDKLINRTIASTSGSISNIGNSAFAYCSALTTASFPVATNIGDHAFYYCTRLTTVSFPAAISIESGVFQTCTALKTASFPVVTSIGANAFAYCSALMTANFPAATNIVGNRAFLNCCRLISLYLTSVSSVPTLGNYAFSSTPIDGYSTVAGRYGSVYVPASLYSSFLTATNWASISSRIVSI